MDNFLPKQPNSTPKTIPNLVMIDCLDSHISSGSHLTTTLAPIPQYIRKELSIDRLFQAAKNSHISCH